MFGDFKVMIQERPQMISNRVFLYQNTERGTVFVTHKGTTIQIAEGAKIDDDEVYFADMSNDMLQAFAQTLADKGIKTNKDSIAEGKLSATERHLEDMRTIVLSKFNKETK